MYAFIVKGSVVGHVLTRRVLREITEIPGIAIDVILALFWMPDYTSYWNNNSAAIYYLDGTSNTGVMQGLFGWIGELLGFAFGAPLGGFIGALVFIPDLILRGILFLKETVFQLTDDFALFVGNYRWFTEIGAYQNPIGYFEKAWNISLGTIGVLIGVVPYTLAKIVEFVFPFISLAQPISIVSTYT